MQPTWLNDVGYVYSMKWVSDGRVIGYPALSTNVNFSNGGPYTNNLDLVIHGPLSG